jgi:hypothetical protein
MTQTPRRKLHLVRMKGRAGHGAGLGQERTVWADGVDGRAGDVEEG